MLFPRRAALKDAGLEVHICYTALFSSEREKDTQGEPALKTLQICGVAFESVKGI